MNIVNISARRFFELHGDADLFIKQGKVAKFDATTDTLTYFIIHHSTNDEAIQLNALYERLPFRTKVRNTQRYDVGRAGRSQIRANDGAARPHYRNNNKKWNRYVGPQRIGYCFNEGE